MRSLLALLILVAAGGAQAEARIVTLGGAVTESVFALGAGDQVVGVDQSSLHPVAATKLPQVGYYRSVAAEGILSLRPTLVAASEEAGPPAALDLIRAAGVEVMTLPAEPSLEAARRRIEFLGERLERKEQGKALLASIDDALQKAEAKSSCLRRAQPKALFLFTRGGGNVAAAGKGTAADAMLELAGAKNGMKNAFSGYRPLSAEAVIAAAPEVLVTTTRVVQGMGGEEALLEQPGIGLTPAGKARRVVVLDDLLLLGFGPRVGDGVSALAEALVEKLPEGSGCEAGG